MIFSDRPPLIGIPACLSYRDDFSYHQVGGKYVYSVLDGAGGLPVLIPAVGERLEIDLLLEHLDGLLLTGALSNLEPHHYGGRSARADSPRDPARDATVLPLIPRAIDAAVPLFAICRGMQELNVALGGTLHQHLHETAGRRDHRSDKAVPPRERYGPVHAITLARDGYLRDLLDGAEAVEVNSLHGQGIDRLAPRLAVEAVADDGTIEAVRVVDAPAFALGVQWHPEWRVLENPISRRLFAAFGAACRARESSRSSHERYGALASGA